MTTLNELLESEQEFDPLAALALVEAGADVNTRNSRQETILHRLIALKENEDSDMSHKAINVVSILVNKYKADINAVDRQGKTALHLLIEISRCYPLDILVLLNLGADPHTKDYYGYPLFHRMVIRSVNDSFYRESCETVIKALVQQFGLLADTLNSQNKTALEILLDSPHLPIPSILLLIELGADPKTQSALKQTFLHKLVARNQDGLNDKDKEIITHLVNNYNVNIKEDKNGFGKTALQYLIEKPGFRPEDALFLVSLGADPDTKNSNGDSLLHLLSKSTTDNSTTISALLEVYGATITESKQMKTPLELALFSATRNQAALPNVSALIKHDQKFRTDVLHAFQNNDEKKLSDLSELILAFHLPGENFFALQGKIRGIAFSALQDAIKELPDEEKLQKLQFARTLPVFSQHRSTSFFSSIGRTNTVIQIDKIILDLKSNLHATEASCCCFG